MVDNPHWVERRLALILNNLQTLQGRFTGLRDLFPEWRDQRLLTIAVIEEFQQKLDTVYQSAIVANGIGSLASLVGTVTSIVGVVLSFKNKQCYDGVIKAGSQIAVAGNLTIPVVTLVEKGISESYMRRVKTYVDRDQEFSQPIREFLEEAENLDRLVQQVFGCSVYSDMFRDVIAFCTEIHNVGNLADRECHRVGELLRRRLRGKIPEDIMQEIGVALLRIFGQMSASTGLQRLLQRIGALSREPYFVMTISCLRAYASANSLWQGECTGGAFVGRIDWEKSTRMSIAGHCLIDALSILVDLLYLINNVNGFLDGQSDYSKRLERIKQSLQRELTTLENAIMLNRLRDNDG